MKPPMNKKSYKKTLHNLLAVYQNLVDQNMKNAANELTPTVETSRDITCSFDGSWQKRGYLQIKELLQLFQSKEINVMT